MVSKDYYSTLEIPKNANADDIKKSYRTLAMKYHPDKNSDAVAELKFKLISLAYLILSDPDKRQKYDMYGTSDFDNTGFSWTNFTHGFEFQDIFNNFFNSFSGRTSPFSRQKNNRRSLQKVNTTKTISITLLLMYSGANKSIQVLIHKKCETCSGTGSKSKSFKLCVKCNGLGQIVATNKIGNMITQHVTPCLDCNGTGEVILLNCLMCHGRGTIPLQRQINFAIPPGIFQNMTMQVYDDLLNIVIVNFSIVEHTKYKLHLEGNLKIHVTTTETISLYDAICGKLILLLYFNSEKIKVKIELGTLSNTNITIQNRGIPYIYNNNIRGNLIVNIKVEIPKYSTLKKTDQTKLDKIANILGAK